MLFGQEIRKLREERGLLQRQIAASLEIDGGLYSKIERGERKAKREQVISLAKVFKIEEDSLMAIWLADQIKETVGDEKKAVAQDAINTFCKMM